MSVLKQTSFQDLQLGQLQIYLATDSIANTGFKP